MGKAASCVGHSPALQNTKCQPSWTAHQEPIAGQLGGQGWLALTLGLGLLPTGRKSEIVVWLGTS